MSERMLGAYINSKIKAHKFGEAAKERVREVFADETGEVNVVAIVVLIGVAVLLAILFKEQITSMLNDLFSTISGNASGVVTDPSKATPKP